MQSHRVTVLPQSFTPRRRHGCAGITVQLRCSRRMARAILALLHTPGLTLVVTLREVRR